MLHPSIGREQLGAPRIRLWRLLYLGVLATAFGFVLSWSALALVLLVLLSIFPLHGEWVAIGLCAVALVLAVVIGALTGFGAYMDDLQRQRSSRGWCMRCGYDLRASSGRCPECGQYCIRGRWRRPPGNSPAVRHAAEHLTRPAPAGRIAESTSFARRY